MKIFHLFICLILIAVLVASASYYDVGSRIGALSGYGWAIVAGVFVGVLFGLVVFESVRGLGLFRRRVSRSAAPPEIRRLSQDELNELGLDKYRGPSYPHPVIFADRCIGCQACVDACPHDVLDIVDGVAAAVAPDLCMEDTACQAECPVNPKACIIINTTKDVRSMPTPNRDGATYETNVSGCYLIGDVSGVPLIKNAVKEGSEVVAGIAERLSSAAPHRAEYDIAIIGIGPGGASAAATAADLGLRYIAIEQNNILSTIDLYPKGKYIFFKPDTKDWFGGISATGLGLRKAKYGEIETNENALAADLADRIKSIAVESSASAFAVLIDKIPHDLRPELSEPLREKITVELAKRIEAFVRAASGDAAAAFQSQFAAKRDKLIPIYSDEIIDQLTRKIPGDQRENILALWLGNLQDRGVRVNEFESCKSVVRTDDGTFIIDTEAGEDKAKRTYTAATVVIAIGLRGAPNKLRLPNEDLRITLDGREQPKVIYGLSNPQEFRGRSIVIVGGGNVAVEAAVDLVAVRDGNDIRPRDIADQNKVTLLVRDSLAPTVKFGNKLQLYRCADEGLIDLRFGQGIKEMRENELVIEDVVTKAVVETMPNDIVFALIGGERPNRFLESIGIKIE